MCGMQLTSTTSVSPSHRQRPQLAALSGDREPVTSDHPDVDGCYLYTSHSDLVRPSEASRQAKSPHYTGGKVWLQRFKLAVLCIAIIVVWGLLTLPIVFYHLPSEKESSPGDAENCSIDILAQSADTCYSIETYRGQTCGQYLGPLQSCLDSGVEDDIHIAPQEDQSSVETQAMVITGSGLQLVDPSPECEEAIRPFLCLYLFRLCDGDGRVYEPSCGWCVSIRDDICVREWTEANQLLQRFGFPALPVCEEFPDPAGECNDTSGSGSGSGALEASDGTSSESEGEINCSSIQCREGFYCTVDTTFNVSICRPRCDTWEQESHAEVIAIDVVVILFSLSGLISGIALLLVSVIVRRKMFRFPSAFVVYLTITLIVLALFNLITYVDRPGLYCSSVDLEESVQNTTPFCTMAGIVFHYTLLQEALWWFIHVTVFFWKVKFPFHARSFEEHQLRYIHIAGVLIALVLPIVPVVVVATNGGFGITKFPPILCTGKRGAPTFYSLVLPIIILIQIGITLLLMIIWTIHKQQGLFGTHDSWTHTGKHPLRISTAEKKLLIVFCYYVVLGALALTSFTLSTRGIENQIQEIITYFKCEARGVDPANPCDRSFLDEFTYEDVNGIISYVLLGLFPSVNLIYAVDVKELKQFCCRVTRRRRHDRSHTNHPSANHSSSYTSGTYTSRM